MLTRALAIVAGVLLLVAVALGFAWRHEAAARAAAARQAEAAQLTAAGQLVAAQARAGELAAQARRIPELEAEIVKAQQLAPGSKVIEFEHLATGGVRAAGAPRREGNPATPGPAHATGSPFNPVPPAAGHSGDAGTPSSCLLAVGDVGELRIDRAGLETRAGNRVVVGVASAWRLQPGPATQILAGTIAAPLSQAAADLPTRRAPEERAWWIGGWAEWDPMNVQGTPEYALELDRQLLQLGPVDVGAFAYLGRFYDGRDAQGRQLFTTQARAGVRAGVSF